MRLGITLLFLLAAALCGETVLGQPPNTSSIDIYKNFVGSWVGWNHFLKDGVDTRELVRIEITETKKRDAIICAYSYGVKGEKGFSHRTRQITLNPAKAEMTSHWSNEDKEQWKAIGLDGFAATGLGTFTVTLKRTEYGTETVYEGLFHLEKDFFRYEWKRSSAGEPSGLFSAFSLMRETPSPPTTNP
jgi:hypothetical protein